MHTLVSYSDCYNCFNKGSHTKQLAFTLPFSHRRNYSMCKTNSGRCSWRRVVPIYCYSRLAIQNIVHQSFSNSRPLDSNIRGSSPQWLLAVAGMNTQLIMQMPAIYSWSSHLDFELAFILLQVSCSCVYFTNVLWPDFTVWHLLAAVFYYQRCHHQLADAALLEKRSDEKSTHQGEGFVDYVNQKREQWLSQHSNLEVSS